MRGKGEEYGASIHIEDNMSSGENLDPGQKRVVGSVVQMADSGRTPENPPLRPFGRPGKFGPQETRRMFTVLEF